MYTEILSQFKKQFGQLDKWLGMAADHAKSKNFDPDVFLTLRLAPDQFPLAPANIATRKLHERGRRAPLQRA